MHADLRLLLGHRQVQADEHAVPRTRSQSATVQQTCQMLAQLDTISRSNLNRLTLQHRGVQTAAEGIQGTIFQARTSWADPKVPHREAYKSLVTLGQFADLAASRRSSSPRGL